MYELRILGAVDLLNAEGDPVRSVLTQPKRLALLAHMAIVPAGTLRTRDALLALFWPDFGRQRARKALNQSVYFLRRSLSSDTVVSRGEGLGIDRRRLRCDAADFQTALGERRLEDALELYRGDLLEGFHVDGCADFERWLGAKRREVRERAVDAARRLGARHRTEDRPVEAVHWLRRAMRLAPYDEAVCRELMEGLLHAGDRVGALRAFEAFSARVADELQLEPSHGLGELAAALEEDATPDEESTERHAPPRADAGVAVGKKTTGTGSTGSGASVGAAGGSLATPGSSARRSSLRPEWTWRAGAVLAGALLSLVIVLGLFESDTGSGADRALVEERVVVLEFENRTGDPDLDHLGQMAADWIAQGLKRTGSAQVLGPVRTEDVPSAEMGEASGAGWHAVVGRQTGAGTAVWGSLYGDSSALFVQAHISSVATGELLGGLLPVRISPTEPIDAVNRLTESVVGLLASRFDPRLAAWAETVPDAPSYAAYREFTAGLESDGGREKVTRWVRAWEMDTTFVLPLLEAVEFLAQPAVGRRYPVLRDSLWRLMEGRENRLSRADAHRLDAARARRRGDRAGYHRHLHEAAELSPHLLNPAAMAAFQAGRYREAVEILERPDFPRMWRGYPWKLLTAGLHFLGEHERELEAARRARAALPGALNPLEMHATALAALGRPEAVEEVRETARSIGGEPSFPSEMVIQLAGIELLWHDHPNVARRLLREADRGFRARLAEEESSDLRRRYRWRTVLGLLYLKRFEEALALARTTLEGIPTGLLSTRIDWRGVHGIAAAGSGDETSLRRSLEWLQTVDDVAGAATFVRALIAAQRGDCERAVDILREAIRKGFGHFMIHRRVGLIRCRHHPALVELARPMG